MQVIVVGAGIQGLAVADALARDGHLVQLLERERPGQRASWVAAGLLTPSSPWKYPRPLIELAFASEALYPDFVADLRERTGIDAEHDTAGMLYPVGAGYGADEIAEFTRRRSELGFELEQLDRQALDALQPGFGTVVQGAAWQPNSARVRPPRVLKALVRAVQAAGVTIESECDVTRLLLEDDRVVGVAVAGGQCLRADEVVLAGGAWSAALAATAGVELAVRPVRGQILLLRGPAGLLGPTVNDGDNYMVPRRDGRILVGSTMEEAGFDAVNTPEALGRLRDHARVLFPATADMAEETAWAGLRPATPDRMPYIGPVPSRPGLVLAAGHFRNGILLAPITARLVADILAGRAPAHDLAPFAAGRSLEAVS